MTEKAKRYWCLECDGVVSSDELCIWTKRCENCGYPYLIFLVPVLANRLEDIIRERDLALSKAKAMRERGNTILDKADKYEQERDRARAASAQWAEVCVENMGFLEEVNEECDMACAEATRLYEELKDVEDERDLACAEATRLVEDDSLEEMFRHAEVILNDWFEPHFYFEETVELKVGDKLLERETMRIRKIVDIVEGVSGNFFFQVRAADCEWSKYQSYIPDEELLEHYIPVKEVECQS